MLKTTKEWPAELGTVSKKKISDKKYIITLAYPDKEYSISRDNPDEHYQRDRLGHINVIGRKRVVKINACGNVIGSQVIPEDITHVEVVPLGEGEEERKIITAEYGAPVIAPNGDVYTWSRSESEFNILKWTWNEEAENSCPDYEGKKK